MFTYLSIKKYANKLLPTLESRYGAKKFYTAREVRATVYQRSYNPKFLPLGYIIALNQHDLETIMKKEFPDVDICEYKSKMIEYLNSKKFKCQAQNIFMRLA